MPRIVETIPDHLAPQAEAARAWFSAREGAEFKLTGIVDPAPAAASPDAAGATPLQLILCGLRDGQEVCLREAFRVARTASGFEVDEAAESSETGSDIGSTGSIGSPAPHLDPPVGTRAGWLDAALARHAFVLILFYRGFW